MEPSRTYLQVSLPSSPRALLTAFSLFVRLVADGWCWFVLREKYCWLVADDWFGLREKHCWLVADKPSEFGVCFGVVCPELPWRRRCGRAGRHAPALLHTHPCTLRSRTHALCGQSQVWPFWPPGAIPCRRSDRRAPGHRHWVVLFRLGTRALAQHLNEFAYAHPRFLARADHPSRGAEPLYLFRRGEPRAYARTSTLLRARVAKHTHALMHTHARVPPCRPKANPASPSPTL
jgi:hypothetical protein